MVTKSLTTEYWLMQCDVSSLHPGKRRFKIRIHQYLTMTQTFHLTNNSSDQCIAQWDPCPRTECRNLEQVTRFEGRRRSLIHRPDKIPTLLRSNIEFPLLNHLKKRTLHWQWLYSWEYGIPKFQPLLHTLTALHTTLSSLIPWESWGWT